MRRTRIWNDRVLIPSRATGSLRSGTRLEVTIHRRPMKEFYCGAIIHGCEARLAAPSDEELVDAASLHAWTDHGISEVSPHVANEIKTGARTVARASIVSDVTT